MRQRNAKTPYYTKGMFFRVLTALLILVGILLSLFLGIGYKLLMRNAMEQAENTEMDMLQKTSDIVELSLDSLYAISVNLTANENIISAVVAPDNTRNDRTFEIQKLLNRTCMENDLIQSVYLYVAYDDTIYSANNQIFYRTNEEQVRELMDSYDHPDTVKSSGPNLCNLMDGVYIVQDFPLTGPDRLGVIILKLSTFEFYQLIQGKNKHNTPILVYDQEGLPIFWENTGRTIRELIKSRQEALAGDAKKHFRIFASEKTGLLFLYQSDYQITSQDIGVLVMPMLSFFLIALLIGVFYAIFASHTTYKPIRDFMKIVTDDSFQPRDMADVPVKNEMDYLDQLFRKTILTNQELNGALKSLLPEMESRLIGDILETSLSEQQIDNYLFSINSNLNSPGKFIIFVVDLKGEEELLNVYAAQAKKTIVSWGVPESCARITVNRHNWTILLKLKQDVDQENVEAYEKNMISCIQNIVKSGDVLLQIGVGNCKDSILDIPQSYEEAKATLLLNRYSDVKTKNENHLFEMKKLVDVFLLQLSTCILYENERRGQEARAFGYEILEKSSSEKELYATFTYFIARLNQKYANCNLPTTKIVYYAPEDCENPKISEALLSQIEELCGEYTEVFTAFLQKRSQRLIFLAELYIDKNFANGMLSLGDVAEELQVNASYLSSLFTTIAGISFSGYLSSCRIHAAKELLVQENFSITDISRLCGFNSIQNFTRVFKQYTKQSPGQFRQMERKLL
ncbi:MAG: AraC family transcriptional regulator [Lachnospiraceae bacterium]|nr:AraC family transcriptional regulator [Lachnospiraceae bacterium]